MFLETSYTEQFEATDTHCKEQLHLALANIPTAGADLHFERFENLYADTSLQELVFTIEQGAVGYEQADRTLFHYDVGDLIGLERLQGLPEGVLFSESPTVLRPYNKSGLWQHSSTEQARQWCTYLLAECHRHSAVIAAIEPPTDRTSLGFQSFAANEVIIEEGTDSDTVYSIVEGHATVYVNGVKVGEVLENEIFGAMSLLTNSPRTATVKADRRCLVMVVPRHQFETLIKTHPPYA